MTFSPRSAMAAAREVLPKDARVFQILFLALLLTTGVLLRDFSLHPLQMALAFAAGLATQAFWLKRLGLEQRGFLSAIVTCCGLSLLLRSDTMWAHPLVAALAMSSKFVLRVRGKHLYNPANLGVIAAITLIPGTWVSPGQWGNDLALAVWLLMLGTIVTTRARRLDISWVFLGAFLGLVALRIMLLGQSWAIWWHQLGNGALLLFTFFMISDPMTIPNRRGPRIAYALIVAAAAVAWQYVLFRPNSLIWALFLATPLVPLLDRLFPGEGFSWRGPERVRSIPLRACATSGIPSTAVAEGWPVPARSATTASSSCPGLPSPTSDAPSSRPARPAARGR
jgi:Na+-transporting NADH:ubiquinone oxidoreductase subunit NqrB